MYLLIQLHYRVYAVLVSARRFGEADKCDGWNTWIPETERLPAHRSCLISYFVRVLGCNYFR